MANSSIILSSLDFDTIKSTMKSYLKSQDKFRDYDFDGANMNVLLDVLSYNTYHNSFYLNMVGNEMFLDSALMRDSVVSHAKELNYTPRSFKSAVATINISVKTRDLAKKSLFIPKGYTFTSRYLATNYIFSIPENIVLTSYTIADDGQSLTFTGTGIDIYEGYYINDTFTYVDGSNQRFVISNQTVDTSSITVTVIEDAGATTLSYKRAMSLFDLDSSSRVFFIQGAENDSYEIVFGDGVTGRKPKNNSVISVEYRMSNGELPNGCAVFSPDSTIEGQYDIDVTTILPAAGGNISESVESIKYNAPRHFAAQERAVTTEDYETLLKINFPEVNTVTAYGGENLNPPQFGKVYVSVDLKDVDQLPDIKRQEYYKFLKPRSPVSIDPVFVDPEYTYLSVNTKVNYNINITSLTSYDLQTIVGSAVLQYAQDNLNNFNRTFRYSKLVQAIDNSQSAIISNETAVSIIKLVKPDVGRYLTFDVDFGIPLDIEHHTAAVSHYCMRSSYITYKGIKAYIRDDGNGVVSVISAVSEGIIDSVGVIDYDAGLVQFSNFKIDSFFGSGIKFTASPRNKDITTLNNVILNIVEDDINITIVPVRA